METKTPYCIETQVSDSVGNADDVDALLRQTEYLRREASRLLPAASRAERGQYFTPSPVARRMAAYLGDEKPEIRLLDAGAGVGSLFAAGVAEQCARPNPPRALCVTAFEIDPLLTPYLERTGELCAALCSRAGIAFTLEIQRKDFIETAAQWLQRGLFAAETPAFDAAILNPPYRKIRADSPERLALRGAGIETTNLYTGFLTLAIRLLTENGTLIAITPRSFCNGAYFRPFRREFLDTMRLRSIHVHETRDDAFRDDDVLQETVIVHAIKGGSPLATVAVTSGAEGDGDAVLSVARPYDSVVHPDDPERFIRVVADGAGERVGERMARFTASLSDLHLNVSTGRVVDFRAAAFLRPQPEAGTIPLLYPVHLREGGVTWPQPTRKPQALVAVKATETLLVPNETYVLVKRFSAKEERRRLVASVYDGGTLPGDALGIENHLNYYHANGRGIDAALARGIAVYLNSTLADVFFRQFSGHTQVNATDLRNLPYPPPDDLRRLGERAGAGPHTQDATDNLIREILDDMADGDGDPIQAQKRIEEARAILTALGFPKPQCNERSALTLLALADAKPAVSWAEIAHPSRTIHEMMAFMRDEYGKSYAENSRETIRRQTLHQFVEAGLALANADDPTRPTNSGRFAYGLSPDALAVLRAYRTPEWDAELATYLASNFTLREKYAQERYLARIPVTLPNGAALSLSPGGQNVLIREIIEQFAPRYTPGGQVLYVGDADAKFGYFERDALAALGVIIAEHGKMPDIILHHTAKNWLVLVEAVTSHGPINPKRKTELETLFSASTAGIVLVTAFLTREAMRPYLPEIAWETDVWAADAPDHLIHFNGERFRGPYI